MTKKRETVTYELKDGRQVVYRGTTKDPERRQKEHAADGKHFTRMNVTSRRMTEEGAGKKEAEQLAKYRRSHGGNNPKYNETDEG